MATTVKQNKALQSIYETVFRANPSLESSGRYIKSLRHTQSLLREGEDKQKYEYAINRLLQKHIYYIQSSIIASYGKKPSFIVNDNEANMIKNLAKGEYAVSDSRYSFVDVDTLKQLQALRNIVPLKEDIVIPVNVKSSDSKYKFKTQIVLSKDNILSYATFGFAEDKDDSLHNTVLIKKGEGITHNELIGDKISTRK